MNQSTARKKTICVAYFIQKKLLKLKASLVNLF